VGQEGLGGAVRRARGTAAPDAEFLGAVDRMVRESHETEAWDAALLAARRQVLRVFTGPARTRAERLVGQARLVVANAGRRLLEYRRWQDEQTARRLRELGTALSSVVDVPALTGMLDQQLPGLGIPRWHLALDPPTLDGV